MYEPIIGLEVHAQLKTHSKMFCGCSTEFGAPPNTQVCPVCLGLPGTLPVMNRRALEYAVMTGLAMNCTISEFSKFDRKNYFYPDLPKNYQISQYDKPLSYKGYIEMEVEGTIKRIDINRVHLEEDAGKLIHFEDASGSGVDFNRTGIPLLEIVSEPDINSPQEAYQYLITIKQLLLYLGISDCNMEEGSLRCDANISIRGKGTDKLGVKTEIKNLNSFKAVQKALEYEAKRQQEVLEEGGKIIQETRLWDEKEGRTVLMRSKEEAHDYRYFPEPDLVPVVMDQEERTKELKSGLPELPLKRKSRFQLQYGLSAYDAGVLTSERALADYFEGCTALHNDYKTIANWIMGDLMKELNEKGINIHEVMVSPARLIEMLKLIESGTISGKIAKEVLVEMLGTGKEARAIVQEKGLLQIADKDELEKIILKVIEENPKSVTNYREGKKQAITFLVGQVMKATRGKANPKLVNEILGEKL